MHLFLLFCILLFNPLLVFAENRNVYYEPEVVSLTGVVKVLTFPGPPNYEDIKKGDRAETCGYLTLTQLVDVKIPKTSQNIQNVLERNIKVIQLVIDGDDQKKWKKIKTGNYIYVRGTLYHAFTGHHHSKILMIIQEINELVP